MAEVGYGCERIDLEEVLKILEIPFEIVGGGQVRIYEWGNRSFLLHMDSEGVPKGNAQWLVKILREDGYLDEE